MVRIFFALVLVLGCASPPDERPPARVGVIEVEVDEQKLGAHRARVFGELDGSARVGGGIGASLRRADLQSPDGSLTLRAKVVNFRLRNSQLAFWVGIMAGVDKISARIEIDRGGETLASYTVKRSSIEGSDSSRAATYRLGHMLLKFSDEVGEKLAELDIRDPLPAVASRSEATR